MNSKILKNENGTIELTVTIPEDELEKTRATIVADLAKQTQVPGFRKGKAPKKLVEEKIDHQKVEEEVLRTLIPKAYTKAVSEHNLNPIISPRIHIEKLEKGKDLKFIAETCEAPEINLGKYKEEVKKITSKSKIIVPGEKEKTINFDEITAAILKVVTLKVPQIIIEQETQRLLSQTLDEVKKLGLSLDQYLSSTGKTSEQLQQEYATKAEDDIKIEFVLQEIANSEKIIVEAKEIDEAIAKAKNESERKNLEANKYLLANILRQQKTLDFLKSL